MHVALTEILRCPRCAAGLVLLADRREGARAVEGSLGCPSCGARYPVRDAVADLRETRSAGDAAALGAAGAEPPAGGGVPEAGDAWDAEEGASPGDPPRAAGADAALRLAAFLDLTEARGVVLLIGRTAGHAAELAALVRGVEVATVTARPAPRQRSAADRVSALLTGRSLPLFDRRLAGVGLGAGAHVELDEAVRVLAPRRRIVVDGAPEATGSRLEALGCRVLAAEDRVVVAERSGAPDPPRLYQLG
jgi:uncharacterized protein YbaR (Trm112 family)